MSNIDTEEKHYLPVSLPKSFLISFINGLLILILSFSLYLGIFSSIKSSKYSAEISAKQDSYQTILNLGKTSGLYKSNDTNTSQFSKSNYYEYFVGTLLKTDFLSDDYDLESDPEGFKNKESSFDEFKCITIHDNFVDDDYIGNFFTNFLIGRVDTEGNSLISYASSNSVSYYLHTILKVDDPNSGGQFFNYTSDEAFPHLIPLVRSRLFAYVVLKNTTQELANFDKLFYNYFIEIFDYASDLLMKDSSYSRAYESFDKNNKILLNYEYFATFASFIIPVILLSVIFPILNKDRKNVGCLLTNSYPVNEDEKFGIVNLLLGFLFDLIKYFFITYLISLFGESQVMTHYLFYIGKIGVSFSLFAGISLIFVLFSLVFGFFNSDDRTLSSYLSGIYICKRARNFERNTHSDTALE